MIASGGSVLLACFGKHAFAGGAGVGTDRYRLAGKRAGGRHEQGNVHIEQSEFLIDARLQVRFRGGRGMTQLCGEHGKTFFCVLDRGGEGGAVDRFSRMRPYGKAEASD